MLVLAMLLPFAAQPAFAQKTKGKSKGQGQPAASSESTVKPAVQAAVSADSSAQRAAHPPLSVPDQRVFSFVSQQKAVLPGQSQERQGNGSAGPIKDADRIGDLAVVSLFYQNSCYTDGRYNNNDFPVERGYVTDAGGSARFPAFRVSPPQRKFTNFLASRHALSYRFASAEDYTVYRLSQGLVTPAVRIPAGGIKAGADTLIRELTVSELAASETYVFVPDSKGLSAFTAVAPGVEAARVWKSDAFSLFQFNYRLKASLFDTDSGFPYGPASHQNCYSYRRQFYGVTDAAGAPGVVWQDTANLTVSVTWFGAGLQTPNTVALANERKELLGAACCAPDGTLYYLTFEAGSGVQDGRARTMGVYRAGADGKPLASGKLDTSAAGLNAVSFGDYVTSMAWSDGRIGVMCGRTMHRSADGLNHQGGIAFVLDAGTLALIRNLGQTSGHSFDSVITAEKDGWFSGVDLGDNYPRGINLNRFDGAGKKSAVVYTFKTEHGSTPASSAGRTYPAYAEISGGGKTFYKWSNDNRTYTELGGLVKGAEGYTVVFAGEASPEGRCLDNARTGSYLVDPRNVGVVLVREDFWNVAGLKDTLIPPGLVLTKGVEEKGGFYTFGGTWSPQNDSGVVWLTDYRDKDRENASRIKTVGLEDGTILVLWEKWNATAYVSTHMVRIDPYGRRLSAVTDLGPGVRLGRREEPVASGSRVYLFGGDKVTSSLQLFAIEWK